VSKSEGKALAPEGKVWRCKACGKESRTRYGFVEGEGGRGSRYLPDGSRVSSPGWDESCMLNAVLVDREPAP
jgi:hypothetical protein